MDDVVFYLPLPVWIIGTTDREVRKLLQSTQPGGECATPLFTDNDLAQTFLAKNNLAGRYLAIPVADGDAVVGLLGAMERNGINHVLIDERNLWPIDLFKSVLLRAIDESPEVDGPQDGGGESEGR